MVWRQDAARLGELLKLEWPAVGIAFLAAPPAGVERCSEPAAAGCAYWRQAAEGRLFYTEPSDHLGCPIGAYTHGLPLPPSKQHELEGLLRTMLSLEYMPKSYPAQLPQLTSGFKVAVYGPVEKLPVEPSIVIVRGTPRQIMSLCEAALNAGLAKASRVGGLPTCSIVPETVRTGEVTTNLGCIGNRVYTGLADDEFYAAIPGSAITSLVRKLETAVRANEELERFHRSRLSGQELP